MEALKAAHCLSVGQHGSHGLHRQVGGSVLRVESQPRSRAAATVGGSSLWQYIALSRLDTERIRGHFWDLNPLQNAIRMKRGRESDFCRGSNHERVMLPLGND